MGLIGFILGIIVGVGVFVWVFIYKVNHYLNNTKETPYEGVVKRKGRAHDDGGSWP